MSSFAKQLGISVIISYTFSISAWYLYSCYTKYKSNKIPIEWKRVGTIEKIILYPLKSGNLKEVNSAECTEMGLREVEEESSTMSGENKHLLLDRSFVAYDIHKRKSLNYIKYPTVVLISVNCVDSDHVVFRAPGVEDLILNLSHVVTRYHVYVDNYGVKMDATDCGDEAAKWLSKYINDEGEGHRLGYYAEKTSQRPDPIGTTLKIKNFSKIYKHWRKTDGGAYSHLTSYMIVSSPSIEDVNSKLPPEDKFFYGNLRPNIVVGNCEKYAEDEWKWIKIGENVVMRTVKPCTRCAAVTVNPNNGRKNKKMEPLKTLKSYRTLEQLTGQTLQGDKAVLGINVGLYEPGVIRIDDPVYVDV